MFCGDEGSGSGTPVRVHGKEGTDVTIKVGSVKR